MVGKYRIDFVVGDGAKQVAVECDGDRYHGYEQIPEDMARQAVLEGPDGDSFGFAGQSSFVTQMEPWIGLSQN